MRDLFQEPFHKELHEIMLRKGYKYQRVFDEFINANYDSYRKNNLHLSFWQDDFVIMVDPQGREVSLDIFITETDGIFDPDKIE
jgi:hypothetical protein